MPNHCTCTVTVIGHKEDLDEFQEHQFSFQHFIPRPAEAEADWYTWNVQHWGTKWEAWDYDMVERDENLLVVSFVTAWSPPVAFFEALLQHYPRCWLKCTFHEEGGMAGVWVGWVKEGAVKNKYMIWSEPEAYLTTDGQIHIPDNEDGSTDLSYETKIEG